MSHMREREREVFIMSHMQELCGKILKFENLEHHLLDVGSDGKLHVKFEEAKHVKDRKETKVKVIGSVERKDEETREKEKTMLRELNLQLAEYMAKMKSMMVQSLEKEKRMNMFKEMVINKKSEMFEKQIEELKSQMNDIGKQKSLLQEKFCISEVSVKDLNQQINKWKANSHIKEAKIATLESDVKNYMAQLHGANQQLKDKEQQLREANLEIERLRKECEELNKESCQLRSGKQEVEAKMERLESQQISQEQINQTFIEQIRNEWKNIVGNITPADSGEMEIKKTMQELRKFFDQEYSQAKINLENKYIKQIEILRSDLNSEKAEVRGLKGENSKEKYEKNNLQKRLDKMSTDMDMVKDLNDKIMAKNCGIEGEVVAKNHQLNQLREEIEELRSRFFVDISKTEILLSEELEEYRKLLSTEEMKTQSDNLGSKSRKI